MKAIIFIQFLLKLFKRGGGVQLYCVIQTGVSVCLPVFIEMT